MHCRLVRFIGTLVAALAISLAPESISAQVLVGNYPDLTGIWLADFTEYGGRFTREDPPLQPQALAVFNRNREGLSFGDTGLDPLDPLTFCYPVGALRQMLLRHFEIFQTPKEVLFIHEFDSAVRRIYLDGRAHPDGWPFGWMGHSVGHYDGDSLVVDTVGFNDKTWFDRAGNFHSDALHVVERFTPMGSLNDMMAMQYEATIEDPQVFTRPWTIRMPLYRRLEDNAQLLEFRCQEFVEELAFGHLRKEQLVKHWEGGTLNIDITRKIPKDPAVLYSR